MPRTARTAEILVKVGRTAGRVTEVLLDDDKTVEAALEAAEITITSTDRIRVGGKPAKQSDILKNGDIVTISGKIEGGTD